MIHECIVVRTFIFNTAENYAILATRRSPRKSVRFLQDQDCGSSPIVPTIVFN